MLPFVSSEALTAGKRQIAARFRALGQRPDWPIKSLTSNMAKRPVSDE